MSIAPTLEDHGRGNVKRELRRKRWTIEERTKEPGILTDNFSFSELAREKMWSRIHLIPVLQAEEDRDLVRRHWAQQAREKELMGAETKVYNNDRYATDLRNRTSARNTDRRTDSCAPHTQSLPARLRSRRGPGEPRRIKAKGQESHVVNIAGSGAFFHVGNHRPMTVSNVHSYVDTQVLALQTDKTS